MRLNLHFLILLLATIPTYAQEFQNPKLYPFELGGKGDVVFPDSVPEGVLMLEYQQMQLRDIPNKYSYRTVAYFDTGKLFTLHVLFGEWGNGLSFEDYEAIKNILIPLWKEYPNGEFKGRYHKENMSWIWETPQFRIEWIYQNQPGTTTKKMGWLFIYSQHKTNFEY